MSDPIIEFNLYKPVSHTDAFYLVNAKATYYLKFVRVFIPNKPYEKLKPGLELRKAVYGNITPKEPDEKNVPNENDIERSIRRTRKSIKDYTFRNEFDHLATFTFKEDRQDVSKCKSKMSNWLKNQQKRSGKFDYLIVPEFHKDSESIHFHALIKGFKGRIKQSISSKTGKPLKQKGRNVYEYPGYTLGFTNVKIIDNKEDTDTKVAFYIQKYITKDMPLIFGKNRYWASRGLIIPAKENNPEKWYEMIKPDREYPPNEYGRVIEFDIGKHPLIDMFWEANK